MAELDDFCTSRPTWATLIHAVSDYTGIEELIMHGVAGDGTDAAAASLTAGVDMEMVSTNHVDFGKELLAGGRISEHEIDDAVRRILRVEHSLGLFEHPYVDEAGEVTAGSATARAKARTAGGRSMVLLKNDRAVLPLQKTAKVAVIGPLAVATYDLNGTRSGLGTGAGTTPPVTVLDGIKAAAGSTAMVTDARGCDIESADTSGFGTATATAAAADVVVLALGESAAMSGEASARSDIDLPGVQQELLAAVVAAGKPVVVVLFNGRPLTLQSTHDTATAILEAWAAGVEAGNAVADVLFGEVNPGGKPPVTFPRAVGQIPVYDNHQNTGRPADPNNEYTSKYLDLPSGPLFGFGFGLSYTSFTISPPKLNALRMSRRGGHLTVSIDVANTGSVAGDEVVQLFLHDPVASISQPIRRLRGFGRVGLESGQSRRVTFTLTTDDVGFYDSHARFVVETGLVEVCVGNSSDADQKVTFTVV